MANRIQYTIGLNADATQLKVQLRDVQTQLSQIAQGGGLSVMTAQMTEASKAASQLSTHLKLATNVETGKLDLSKLNQSLKASGMTLQDYGAKLNAIGAQGQQAFLKVAQSIALADAPIKRSSLLMDKLWLTMKNTMRWQLTSSVLQGFTRALSTAYGYAQDLDRSLNDIRIVSGQSVEQMAEFAKEANKAAKALSISTTDYTKGALIYYQQGLNEKQVKERTDITAKMVNVTGDSANQVSSYMTAIWNNFDDGTKTLEYYADAMAALGAETAASTAEIADSLEKFAAIGETVGLSYEYATAAATTLIAETRQSADTVGTALKTIFARMQDLELGETLDDGTTLGKYSQALKTVGVDIQDTNGGLKDMNIIIDELGQKWETLDRAAKTAVAQAIGGTRQYQQLIGLMDNYDVFKENVSIASGSEGTLQEQADIYAESWEAANKRVRAAAEDIYSSLFESDTFIDFANGLTIVLERIDDIIDGAGGLFGVLNSLFLITTSLMGPKITQGLRDAAYNIGIITNKEVERTNALRIQGIQTSRNLALIQEKNSAEKISAQGIAEEAQARFSLQAIEKNISTAQKENLLRQIEMVKEATNEAVQRQKVTDELRKQNELSMANFKDYSTTKSLDTFVKGGAKISTHFADNLTKDENSVLSNSKYNLINTAKTKQTYISSNQLGDTAVELKQLEGMLDSYRGKLENLAKIQDSTLRTTAIDELKQDFELVSQAAEKFGITISDNFEDIQQISNASQKLNKDVSSIISIMKKMDIPPEVIKDFEVLLQKSRQVGTNLLDDEAYVRRLKMSVEGLNKEFERVATAKADWASITMSVGQALSSVYMLTSAVSGLLETWKNPDLTGWEKATQILMQLSMILFALPQVMQSINILTGQSTMVKMAELAVSKMQTGEITKEMALEKILGTIKTKNASDEMKQKLANLALQKAEQGGIKNTIKLLVAQGKAAWKSLGIWGYVALVVIAAITALVKIFQIWHKQAKENSPAEKLKEAQQASSDLKNSLEETNAKANELKETLNSYDSAIDKLSKCKKGTDEWKAALEDANTAAYNVLAQYPELWNLKDAQGQSVVKLNDGLIEISDSAQRYVLAQSNLSKIQATYANQLGQSILAEKQYAVNENNLIKKMVEDIEGESSLRNDLIDLGVYGKTAEEAQKILNVTKGLTDPLEILTSIEDLELSKEWDETIDKFKDDISLLGHSIEENAAKIQAANLILANQISSGFNSYNSANETIQKSVDSVLSKNLYQKAQSMANYWSEIEVTDGKGTGTSGAKEVVADFKEIMKRNLGYTGMTADYKDDGTVTFDYTDSSGEYHEDGLTMTFDAIAAKVATDYAINSLSGEVDNLVSEFEFFNNKFGKSGETFLNILNGTISSQSNIADIMKFVKEENGKYALNYSNQNIKNYFKELTGIDIDNNGNQIDKREEEKAKYTSSYDNKYIVISSLDEDFEEKALRTYREAKLHDMITNTPEGKKYDYDVQTWLHANYKNIDTLSDLPDAEIEEIFSYFGGSTYQKIGTAAQALQSAGYTIYDTDWEAQTLKGAEQAMELLGITDFEEYQKISKQSWENMKKIDPSFAAMAAQHQNELFEKRDSAEFVEYQEDQEAFDFYKSQIESFFANFDPIQMQIEIQQEALETLNNTYSSGATELEISEFALREYTDALIQNNNALIGNEQLAANAAIAQLKYAKSMNQVAKSIQENSAELETWAKSNENTNLSIDALEAVSQISENLTAAYNGTKFNEEWIHKNFNLIKEAASGSAEAVDLLNTEVQNLDLAQLKEDLETLDLDNLGLSEDIIKEKFNTSDFDDFISKITQGFDQLQMDLAGKTIGSEITLDPAFIETLNTALETGIITKDKLEGMFDNLHVDIPIGETTVTTEPQTSYQWTGTVEGASTADPESLFADVSTGLWTATVIPATKMTVPKIGDDSNSFKVVGDSSSQAQTIRGSGGTFGGASNKGGGSSKKHSHKDNKIEKERYLEINKTIDSQSRKLSQLNDEIDRTYGPEKLNMFNNALNDINASIDLQKQKTKEATEYLQEDIAELANLGFQVQFDKFGNISNEEEILEAAASRYNTLSKQWDGQELSDSQQDQLDKAKEYYEDIAEIIEKINEDKEVQIECEEQILELQLQQSETLMKQITESYELYRAFADARDAALDFRKSMNSVKYDGLQLLAKDTNIELEKSKQAFGSYLELQKQAQQLKADYDAGKIKDETAYIEQMQTLQSEIYSEGEKAIAYVQYMDELWANTLSTMGDEFDHLIEKVDKSSAKLSAKLTALEKQKGITITEEEYINAGIATKDTQYDAELSKAKRYREEIDILKQSLTDVTLTTEERYATENRILELETQLAETGANAMDIALEKWELVQRKAEIIYDRALKIREDQTDWDNLIDKDSWELDEVNTTYESNKLNRSIQQSIDKASSTAAANTLKNLQKEIDLRKQNNKLSQYDVDILNAKYDMTLKQIALEEAQNAKSQVRLVRDSQGNWNYQYTADQAKIDEARQAYEDSANEYYNIAKEQVKSVTDQILAVETETKEKIVEILNDATLTEEEQWAYIEQIQAHANEKISFLLEEQKIAYADYSEAGSLAVSNFASDLGDKALEINKTLSDPETGFAATVQGYINSLKEGYKNFAEDVSNAATSTKTTLDGEDGLNETIKETQTAVENADKATSKYAETVKDTLLPELANAVTSFNAERDAILEVVAAYEKLAYLPKHEIDQEYLESQDYSAQYNAAAAANNDQAAFIAMKMKWAKIDALGWNKEYFDSQGWEWSTREEDEARFAADAQKNGWSIKAVALATGGYTGDWNSNEGKLAILHEKELVLNKMDTQRILAAVEAVRTFDPSDILMNMDEIIDNYKLQISTYLDSYNKAIQPSDNIVQQIVSIDAHFDGVTSAIEIEQALNNLLNDTAQYVNTRR